MGPYLAVPKKEKESVDKENTKVTLQQHSYNCLVEIWRDRDAGLA